MFEIKKSPLRLIEFFLLENHFSVKSKGISSPKDVDQFFESYPISIDFAHQDTDNEEFHVFVMIEVNADKKIPGYSMACNAMGIFELPSNELDKDSSVYKNLKLYSTVNMVINHIRNVISGQTAFAPHGRYNLPPIDIGDLFAKKAERQKPQKTKK
jgi:preprotein translocase subunit SecB